MESTIIISICVLLILAYAFDITASKTRIPSVILLLLVGWSVKQLSVTLDVQLPDFTQILPVLGTVGLILIVLEGSLELELNHSKLPFVGKTAIMSFVPMLLFSFGLAYAFQYFGNVGFKVGLANAIPFAVISSAIAIPSVQNFLAKDKEFITYESSLSDIFGVIFFNFITRNDNIGSQSVGMFFFELFILLTISVIATMGLAYLLSKIKHKVKFLPIILMIVLIYSVSKIYHLPALLFILLFGLFLNNLDEFKNHSIIQKLQPSILNNEVHKFKELTTEISFLIRVLFFILFGFLINTNELLNSETIVWAIGICIGIFSLRLIFLRIFNIKPFPVLFIAPRGLITILLFLNIPATQTISLANNSLIIQVIVLTALIMMTSSLTSKPKTNKTENLY